MQGFLRSLGFRGWGPLFADDGDCKRWDTNCVNTEPVLAVKLESFAFIFPQQADNFQQLLQGFAIPELLILRLVGLGLGVWGLGCMV